MFWARSSRRRRNKLLDIIDANSADHGISAVMRFVTKAAPPAICDHVLELWLLEDEGLCHAGLPKPYVELVVSLSGIHWWRAGSGAAEHRYDEAWVTPLQRGPRYARAEGQRRLIGARLQPWSATALFGVLPPGDGRPPPPLASLIGADSAQLRNRLLAAGDDEARFAAFADWLRQRLAPIHEQASYPAIGTDVVSVAQLAASFAATPRSLRRRFARDVGLSPKQWLKLRRLDGLLRAAALGERTESLAEMALEHGFADQSHLARDVAHLAGTTPAVLRRRERGLPPHLLPGA